MMKIFILHKITNFTLIAIKKEKINIINEVLYELNDKDNISNKNKEEQKYYFNCARKNITPNVLKADT